MVLTVVKYGDPVLRKKGAKIEAITPEISQLIADMFETMKAAHGVGLAAQQIGRALQLTVIDVRGVKDRPSQLWLAGQEADVESFMPLVLLNPVVRPMGGRVSGPEGCLSFPDIFGPIERSAEVEVTAQNERGESYSFKAGGLLARAIQHEVDHLNGILFIDRMAIAARDELKPEIDELQAETKLAMAKAAARR
ncbi:MAG TPA: peptide deformylase [Candidatus Limnocylindria bacterium]|jgi:peptide deformylase|nr:peptide deformylase [Candidatus Limnocylindria bacterium]